MNKKIYRNFIAIIVAQLILLGGWSLQSQDNHIVLTLAVPDYTRTLFDTQLLHEFEEIHPNISVIITRKEAPAILPVAMLPQWHLDAVYQYVESADVLYVASHNFSLESARAGYFLDLAPLVRADSSLGQDDFWPSIWQSYQWEGGVWALPVATDIIGLTYDPVAFDDAGLDYPNGRWEMADLANAARILAQRDDDGSVVLPGLADPYNGFEILFRGLLNHGLFDPTTIPSTPDFSDPQLESLVADWTALRYEGVNNSGGSTEYTLDDIPMVIEDFTRAFYQTGNNEQRGIALLPGNVAGLNTSAFAVSSGTAYPEAAYELAKFLTTHPDVSRLFGIVPARQSLLGVDSDIQFARPDISTSSEFANILDIVSSKAIPVSETRFMGYLVLAFDQLNNQTTDIPSAIQYAESQAFDTLSLAESRRESAPIVVVTPMPTPIISPNEVALRFGVITGSGSIDNQHVWDQLITQFVENDPQVGHINFEHGMISDAMLEQDFDCFYSQHNLVGTRHQPRIFALDPLMSADPNFDEDDWVAGALASVEAESQTWAYPVVLFPNVLWYAHGPVSNYGLTPPETGWDISIFRELLEAIQSGNPVDPPFFPRDYSGNYLRMLIAAFGGIPLDLQTSPPIINFTSQENIYAIQQVLDLAKQDYIQYQPLATYGEIVPAMGNPILFDDTLGEFSAGFHRRTQSTRYAPTLFPHGQQYAPVSFSVGAAYINSSSLNPEACYRFITTIAEQPGLFQGMPAQRSLLDNSALVAAYGADVVDFYRDFDAALQNPNAILLNPPNTRSGFYVQYWLNKAFDEYVFEDATLEDALAEAELFAMAFLECIEPEFTTDEISNCASTIDPSVPW